MFFTYIPPDTTRTFKKKLCAHGARVVIGGQLVELVPFFPFLGAPEIKFTSSGLYKQVPYQESSLQPTATRELRSFRISKT